MNIALKLLLALFFLIPLPYLQSASATSTQDWVGTYDMDHDGWHGTLVISQSGVACGQPAWCALTVVYRDANNTTHGGRVERMDDRLEEMRFIVAFPGNAQPFTAYLFTHEPGKLAGTTNWSGRTFGFYALRQVKVARSEFAQRVAISHRILPTGEIERRLPNGVIERIGSGQITQIMPDGSTKTMMMDRVIPVTKPLPPPQSSVESQWLDRHANGLLDILIELAPDDPNARANYLASEGNVSPYERINRRTEAIGHLVGH